MPTMIVWVLFIMHDCAQCLGNHFYFKSTGWKRNWCFLSQTVACLATLFLFKSVSRSPSQPYFSGTRSLSPMSSLFGSIWTPQSEPYQSHFHQERSAPVSPHTVSPHATFSREPGGSCPPKQYSSFNPFGPHMNLDIWNSSSSRSSNSQLSNDSGYCGDIWKMRKKNNDAKLVMTAKTTDECAFINNGENVNILFFCFSVNFLSQTFNVVRR